MQYIRRKVNWMQHLASAPSVDRTRPYPARRPAVHDVNRRVRRVSLKLRLTILITTLIALLTLGAGIYIVERAHDDIRGEVRSATTLTQQYLLAELSIARSLWQRNPGVLPHLELTGLREVRHIEVRFYDTEGHLLDSNAGGGEREAKAPDWFVWLIRATFPPIEDNVQAVKIGDLIVGKLVIHPDPTYEIDEIWTVTRGLFGILLTFFVLVNVLVWWAVGQAMRPVEQIRAALDALGAGKLDTRMPPLDVPELAGVTGDFNHMAGILQTSVAENERLALRLLQIQDDERSHIARELHDEIGQCVTAIHADAVAIQHLCKDRLPDIRESTTAIVDVTATMKEILRSMLQRLHPYAIDRYGLDIALHELVAGFRQRNPAISCLLTMHQPTDAVKGPTAIAIYRLLQESLTNITRHARAGAVWIEIDIDRGAMPASEADRSGASALRLTIRDDGAGFAVDAVVEGVGLLGMRERAKALHGSFSVVSMPGRGTCVTANLPWPERCSKGS
jgi:two-component system, NarL family, sensor histidine kinase UhpB